MKLREFVPLWRKMAEKLGQSACAFSLPHCYANVTYVFDAAKNARLTRIPSLSRGSALLGAAPVFLSVRIGVAPPNPFPRNLPLPMTSMSKRPRRTDHV